MTEVSVPDIGDFKEVEVIEVLVKAGDAIAAEQSLITVESDKATMEIPAPGAGVIKELRVKVGDKVSQGTPILVLEEGKGQAAKAATPKAEAAKREPPKAAPVPVAAPKPSAGGPMTVKVPDIGDFKEVAVIEVLVKPGDTVSAEQSLITVESDKATMEIPAPAAGRIAELKIKVGDKVSEGSPILVMESDVAPAPACGPTMDPICSTSGRATARRHPPLKSVQWRPRRPRFPKPPRRLARPCPRSRWRRCTPSRTPVRRCASSRANWAWISRA